MVSPILNLEYTKILTNICYDFFFNWQTEKKNCFGPIKMCFLFQVFKLKKNRGKNQQNKLVKISDEFVI